MSPLPTLPLLVDAFIADTAHMTVEEVGAHIRLLVFAWRSPGCCLPDDDARLARMLGLTAKRWAALKPSVMALWQRNSEGNFTHDRLTHEHQFVTSKIEKKRSAGRLGGRPKSLELQNQDKASGSVIGKQSESERKPPTPTPTESPLSPSGEDPDGFAEFRSNYPKRNAAFPTTQARKRWLEARRRGAKPEEIIAGAKAYAAEQQRIGKVGTGFVRTADSWLHQQRWRDHATAASVNAPAPAPVADETWRERIRNWRARGGHWPWRPSPPPDDPRTLVPQHILDEFGLGAARDLPVLMTGTR
ncbi:hypothetical protein C0214_21425 [Methylobacterium sp. DM1]|nr:hypothetical protein C0214_21425 [Methylobacterium sp. DM1]